MNRSLSSIAIVLVAAASLGVSLSSCNTPSCGPGTVQQQQKNGELKCVPVDQPEAGIACDTDGGNVVIVGGKCVSAVQCDPGTTMNVNGICVGTGMGGVQMCSSPATGKACVWGYINNFTDNMKNTVPVHVVLYDAVGLLQGGGMIASFDSSDGGSYIFKDFAPPPLGTIVVMTTTGTGVTMTNAGTGAINVTANSQFRVDAYAIPKTDSDKWGFDITTGGAQIAKYYKDPKPTSPNQLIANETMPASGVTMVKDGSPAMGAQYFADNPPTMVSGSLTSTGPSGVAIVASPIPMGGMFPTFSGSGGGISPWETLNGGSAMGVVIITRFHPGP